MVRSFFAFSEQNKTIIYNNLFFLARWGFSQEYLCSVPVDEFYYYIKLFNKNKQMLGLQGIEDNVAGVSNPPEGAGPNKPIGEVIPRGVIPNI